MERITYTAPNLMDWAARLKAGAATVKVHFSGGAITSFGVTPAEYTTTNPFIQKVIEQSQYFKEGRIRIGRRVQLPDPAKPKSKPPTEQAPAPAHAQIQCTPSLVEASAASGADAKEPTADESPGDRNGDAEENITMIEVSCLPDAQDYLQQNFGISSYKVRSKVAAQKAAAEHGVMFVGGGFAAVHDIDAAESESPGAE